MLLVCCFKFEFSPVDGDRRDCAAVCRWSAGGPKSRRRDFAGNQVSPNHLAAIPGPSKHFKTPLTGRRPVVLQHEVGVARYHALASCSMQADSMNYAV